MALKFIPLEIDIMMKNGISRDRIRKWETGVANPSKDISPLLADILKRDELDILHGRNPGDEAQGK